MRRRKSLDNPRSISELVSHSHHNGATDNPTCLGRKNKTQHGLFTMNRDEGQYFLPHIPDEILIKKHQIDKSTDNTKNIARRQSSVSSQWWLRQQLIAEMYTVSAYFGSEFENYCLSWIILTGDFFSTTTKLPPGQNSPSIFDVLSTK